MMADYKLEMDTRGNVVRMKTRTKVGFKKKIVMTCVIGRSVWRRG